MDHKPTHKSTIRGCRYWNIAFWDIIYDNFCEDERRYYTQLASQLTTQHGAGA